MNIPLRPRACSSPMLEGGPPAPIPTTECCARLDVLRITLGRMKLDGAWIISPINRLYYTGIQTSNGLLVVPADGSPRLYTDFRYREAAGAAAEFLEIRSLPSVAAGWMTAQERRQWRRIGFEAGRVDWQRAETWRRAMPRVRAWVALDAAIARQRAVKSAEELARIRRAAAAADHALREVIAEIQAGWSEWEIRRLIRARLDEVAEGEAFATIVATGPNASRCHHEPNARRWSAGEPLLIDLGAVVGRYCSDMTRVVWTGKMSRQWCEIYRHVNEARAAAIAALRPGLTGRELDAIARQRLREAGLARFFGHGLGHGVGLEIHEFPRLSPRSSDRLEAGMVVTIEPGIYMPGEGGIRIEDLVLVTKQGAEVLSSAPRDIRWWMRV